MNWETMETAPQTGRIDIWAKRWVSKTDSFECKRFPDCFWRSTHFSGLSRDWHATHWVPAPKPPEDYSEWGGNIVHNNTGEGTAV